MDGLLWNGTTQEEAVFDENPTTEARDEIMASILKMIASPEPPARIATRSRQDPNDGGGRLGDYAMAPPRPKACAKNLAAATIAACNPHCQRDIYSFPDRRNGGCIPSWRG